MSYLFSNVRMCFGLLFSKQRRFFTVHTHDCCKLSMDYKAVRWQVAFRISWLLYSLKARDSNLIYLCVHKCFIFHNHMLPHKIKMRGCCQACGCTALQCTYRFDHIYRCQSSIKELRQNPTETYPTTK